MSRRTARGFTVCCGVRMVRMTALAIVLFTLFGWSVPTREKHQKSSVRNVQGESEQWVEKTMSSLSLEEKVGQLFMVRMRVEFLEKHGTEYAQLLDSIRKYHVGALAMSAPMDGKFVRSNRRIETVMLLNQLQNEAKLPLLVAGDFERGVLPPRLFGTTVFPHAMAFGAAGKLAYAEEFGRITAQESRALGVHWNLFPVADVNSNPANPIIGTRAFGEDPQQVGDLVAAYIRGARANGMMTTAKHFPGHGNTATDSHLAVPKVDDDVAQLQKNELPPFRKAIDAGVDAVMTAHVRVLALDPDPNGVATISPKIVTGLLKNQLGFKGIVVTDALDMAGIVKRYKAAPGRAAVAAFKAGNDVLTMPLDLKASYSAVLQAVRSGEISQARLNASVRKILRAKASLDLNKDRMVDINAIPGLVGNAKNLAEGQRISDDSVTLVRDNRKLLPLKSARLVKSSFIAGQSGQRRPVLVLVLCDNVLAEDGQVLGREMRVRMPDANVLYVDPRIAAAKSDEVLKAVDSAPAVVVGVYIVPSAARSLRLARGMAHPSSLPNSTSELFARVLARAAEKTAVLAMGNPYLSNEFPTIQNYVCTFSNATVSEVSAVKALFGEIPIHGHLPVTLSNVPARTAVGKQPGQNSDLEAAPVS